VCVTWVLTWAQSHNVRGCVGDTGADMGTHNVRGCVGDTGADMGNVRGCVIVGETHEESHLSG
jgi:hypothetical protein